eukprot:TRINITY_DN19273_c0_g1_i1.p1 TRINITY_DN19273_c0_g1~~TRINITY_DN19273_c0_g1_i1.p1  ORF type:complete len:345 (+),score=56.42 TRINITY_DN19273_c0_g1_i1:40-1035(+)
MVDPLALVSVILFALALIVLVCNIYWLIKQYKGSLGYIRIWIFISQAVGCVCYLVYNVMVLSSSFNPDVIAIINHEGDEFLLSAGILVIFVWMKLTRLHYSIKINHKAFDRALIATLSLQWMRNLLFAIWAQIFILTDPAPELIRRLVFVACLLLFAVVLIIYGSILIHKLRTGDKNRHQGRALLKISIMLVLLGSILIVCVVEQALFSSSDAVSAVANQYGGVLLQLFWMGVFLGILGSNQMERIACCGRRSDKISPSKIITLESGTTAMSSSSNTSRPKDNNNNNNNHNDHHGRGRNRPSTRINKKACFCCMFIIICCCSHHIWIHPHP